MKTLSIPALLLGTLLIAVSPAARADIASGSYTNTFSGDITLWDISGTYSESLDNIKMEFTINMDSSGKFTGAGSFSYDDWSNNLDGDFTISGSVKSSGNVVRVSMTMLINGSGYVQGYDVIFSAKMNESLEIDGATQQLIGTVSGSIKVQIPSLGKKGSTSIPRSQAVTPLPNNVDGTWTLSMNVVPNGTKYTGTGLVELSNGKSIDLNLTGSYSGKKDTSTIALKTVSPGSFNLKLLTCCTNLQMDIQSMKGTALGQKLTIK
jgi:hypothetical protein